MTLPAGKTITVCGWATSRASARPASGTTSRRPRFAFALPRVLGIHGLVRYRLLRVLGIVQFSISRLHLGAVVDEVPNFLAADFTNRDLEAVVVWLGVIEVNLHHDEPAGELLFAVELKFVDARLERLRHDQCVQHRLPIEMIDGGRQFSQASSIFFCSSASSRGGIGPEPIGPQPTRGILAKAIAAKKCFRMSTSGEMVQSLFDPEGGELFPVNARR